MTINMVADMLYDHYSDHDDIKNCKTEQEGLRGKCFSFPIVLLVAGVGK